MGITRGENECVLYYAGLLIFIRRLSTSSRTADSFGNGISITQPLGRLDLRLRLPNTSR